MIVGMPHRGPKLLTLKGTARWLKVDPSWLEAEAKADRLPHVAAGNGFLFDPGAVESALVTRAGGDGPPYEPVYLLTLNQMADALGRRATVVSALAEAGVIPYYRTGKAYLFERDRVVVAVRAASLIDPRGFLGRVAKL